MKRSRHAFSMIGRALLKNPLLTLLMLLSVAASVTAAVLPPLVLEQAVDSLSAGNGVPFKTALLYFSLLALSGIFDSLMEFCISVLGQRINHAVRSEMMAKLTELSADYFVRNESGAIASRIVGDVDTLEQLFSSGIVSMCADALKLISIIAVVFVKSKGLGILLLLISPLLILFTRLVQKRMLKAQYEGRVAVGHAAKLIPETLHNLRTIHVFGASKYMKARYEETLEDGFKCIERSNFYDAVYSPVVNVLSAIIIGVMMILACRGGSWSGLFGMSVGTAVAVISYVDKIFEPIEAIGTEIQSIVKAAAGIKRINVFMDEETDDESSKDTTAAVKKDAATEPHTENAISVESVHFHYQGTEDILKDLSFSVKKGENVTLTGRTGAGKTTVFKLLLGLYRPQSGTVRVFQKDPTDITPDKRRMLFGYVGQGIKLLGSTVREQVTLGDKTITDEQVRDALRLVGLEHTVSRIPGGLDAVVQGGMFSEGELQLLAIARAVVSDPELLLLDEITAKLDSATELKVLNALNAAKGQRTVLSISHRVYRLMGAREIRIGYHADAEGCIPVEESIE